MMWQISLQSPWLIVRFPQRVSCLGWTPQGGGLRQSTSLLWRQVRDEDLSESFDVLPWLAGQTTDLGFADAPCFLTSAQISDFAHTEVQVADKRAAALVTAGLGNAERIGQRRGPMETFGTINAAVIVDCPLSQPAALEALSLMAEARTTAMLEHAPAVWGVPMTGTGTDCLTICFPQTGGEAVTYCGKHTALGEAIGAAALQTFTAAIRQWRPAQ